MKVEQAHKTETGFIHPTSHPVQSHSAHLYFGSDEETGDAYELQRWFKDVSLRAHEAIKVVLSQVVCLPVQFVHLAHLKHAHKQNVTSLMRPPGTSISRPQFVCLCEWY